MLRDDDFIIHDATPWPTHTPGTHARGLVPRPFDQFPQGCYRSAAAFDMPTIDRNEWPDRIKEGEANQSFLSHIRRRSGPSGGLIPSLDQNGKGYCATADTEVLTERGWVAYPDYNWSDPIATVNPLTHGMEFQAPFQRHVYEYDGPMIYSTNRRIDFGVTPDHEMYVRKWDERRRTLSDRYSFVRAGDLGWYAGLLAAPAGWIGTELVEVEVPGDRRYDGDDFVAMLGLVISDGYAGGADGRRPGAGTRNWVSFASFREDTLPAVRALAARLGFRECPSRPGVFVRYDAGALAAWVRQHCYTSPELGAKHKRVPEVVKVCSVRQIKHFLHWFDDRTRDASQFFSTSKRLTDDLQELFLRTGTRSSIGRKSARDIPFAGNASGMIRSGEGYVLTVGSVDRLCLDKKKHIETDRYKGLVYCAAVPNHTLLTRRNGSVLISSNCWAHSSTMAIIMTRALMGEPYVRLSAFMPACIIKSYRDEGGWGAQSLDFITDNGVPSVEFWPEKSMSRGNDNPAMRANAALHKSVEAWADLAAAQYDRNLTEDQAMTVLLSRIPLVADWNWWSHSTCMLDPTLNVNPTELTTARWRDILSTDFNSLDLNNPRDAAVMADTFGKRGINSWTDSYGNKGEFVLTGSKAHLDGGVAPRVSVPSVV